MLTWSVGVLRVSLRTRASDSAARRFANFPGRARAAQEKDRFASLTPREREIVRLVAQGLRNEQIAERLFVSEKTVRNNLTSVFGKVDVTSRLELVLLARRHELIK